MAILIDGDLPVLVQGITGRQGSFHTRLMQEYGTRVVAGVTPGREGETVHGVPVFSTVRSAVRATGARAAVGFVPAAGARDAAFEAIDAGLELLVEITEGIPVQDTLAILAFARERGSLVIGPNTFGVISPGRGKLGIMPGEVYGPGPVGILARSGTLSYEIARLLCREGPGVSTAVGIGGDPVVGWDFRDGLRAFAADGQTEAVVLIGEIGGSAEEDAAAELNAFPKPVVAFLAGRTAPPGRRMGHAGAIVAAGRGGFEAKVRALEEAGASIAALPWEVVPLVRKALGLG